MEKGARGLFHLIDVVDTESAVPEGDEHERGDNIDTDENRSPRL